ncbi:MAG: flagellar hook protein FlgE [Nitrospira sp.]
MGILSSLFAGVSGLNANGTALSVIGNNIANLSTVGFKSSKASFADLISSSISGGSGAIQTGIGVALTSVQGNFSQGSLSTSSNVLDLAIDGNGFFIVKDAQNATFYSRTGLFRLDKDNNVVDPTGFKLQGFLADTTGAITGNIGDVALPSTTAPPRATTTALVAANLRSNTTIGPTFQLSNPSGTSNFSTSITVFDTLGNGHLLSTYYTKTAANTWEYNVVAALPDINVAGYHAANQDTTLGIVRVGTGTLTFGTNGTLLNESVVTRYDDGTAAGTAGAAQGQLQIDFVGATANQLITMDFGSNTTSGGNGLDGTTQFGAESALVQQTQDGYAAGSLQAFSVDSKGIISGRFSNGQLRALAQVVLSRFPDPIGLTRTGKNTFAQSGNSGQPVNGTPDSAGLGRVLSNSLELSNVDLGESFIDMIAAQRGFQANSRVITTSDEILQELVNLKR